MPLKISKVFETQWDKKQMLLFRSFPSLTAAFFLKFQNLLELIFFLVQNRKEHFYFFFTFVVFVSICGCTQQKFYNAVESFVQVGFTTPNLTGLK